MKKVVIILSVVVVFVFLMGCLDYKAYEIPQGDNIVSEEVDLVDEIAEIEKEIEQEMEVEDISEELLDENIDSEVITGNVVVDEVAGEESEVVEEVILPELTDNEMEDVSDEELELISVKENELVKLNVQVTDPDKDTVTYTFGKPLNKKGEWKTNYGDAGEYLIKIKATDGKLTTEKQVKLIVERVNVAPIIKGVKDLIVNEGETVTFKPVVTDPNSDSITTVISEPLKSGTFVTDHTSAGEYKVSVLATDGELETEKVFKLVVNDVNVLPEISGLKDLVVTEGGMVEIKPIITDLDEDEITLTISEPVSNDGVWQTAFTDHGEFFVTVTANDGKDKVTKQVKIIVEDVNMPPEIVDISLNTE